MSRLRLIKGKFVNDLRIYKLWIAMKYRCYNKRCNDYKYYGARGIKICDEWKFNFLAFYSWSLQNGYNKKLSIDRIDNNLGYCPQNCRWVVLSKQQENKRGGVVFGERHFRAKLTVEKVINIRRRKLLNKEYCKMYGVAASTVYLLQKDYTRWPQAIP